MVLLVDISVVEEQAVKKRLSFYMDRVKKQL